MIQSVQFENTLRTPTADPSLSDDGEITELMRASIQRHRLQLGDIAAENRSTHDSNELDPSQISELLAFLDLIGHPSTAAIELPQVGESPLLEIPIGRFRIIEKIGEGAYGIVLKAYDPQLDREVALKLPRPQALLSGHSPDAYLREARLAARLQHASIVQVHDVGQIGPIWYVASAFHDGPNLLEWLIGNGLPSHKLAARVMIQLAEAIDYAHKRGVIHRDLKPSNVLVSLSTDPRDIPQFLITDFGLASHVTDTNDDAATIRGTLVYMAPEAMRPDSSAPGVASDIYSLGAILYELLSGEPPRARSNDLSLGTRIQQACSTPVASLRKKCLNVPADLARICEKCLSTLPVDRYDSALDFARDLERFCRNEPVVASPIGACGRLWRVAKRRPGTTALLACFLTSWVIGSIVITWMYRREHAQRTIAENERQVARQAVDDLYSKAAEKWLRNVPHMDPVAIDFLEKALKYYESATITHARDSASLYDLQTAYHRSANILDGLGRRSEARGTRLKCLQIIDQLLALDPQNCEYRFAKFHNLMLLGTATSSPSLLNEAHQLLQRLADENPNNGTYHEALLSAGNSLACAYLKNGQADLAERIFRSCIARATTLRNAGNPRLFAKNLAQVEYRLLDMFHVQHRWDEAADSLARLRKLDEEWLAVGPHDRDVISEIAAHELTISSVLQALGRYAEAEKCLLRSVHTFHVMAEDHPESPSNAISSAHSRYVLGDYYWSQEEREKAREQFRLSIATLHDGVRRFPETRQVPEYLAWVRSHCPDRRLAELSASWVTTSGEAQQ